METKESSKGKVLNTTRIYSTYLSKSSCALGSRSAFASKRRYC